MGPAATRHITEVIKAAFSDDPMSRSDDDSGSAKEPSLSTGATITATPPIGSAVSIVGHSPDATLSNHDAPSDNVDAAFAAPDVVHQLGLRPVYDRIRSKLLSSKLTFVTFEQFCVTITNCFDRQPQRMISVRIG